MTKKICMKCKKEFSTLNYKHMYCDSCYDQILDEHIRKIKKKCEMKKGYYFDSK